MCEFKWVVEVRQGCMMSPWLFDVFIDGWMIN